VVMSRGFLILDGQPYEVVELLESDSFEVGTRFVSLHLVELVGVEEEYWGETN